jgi:membrane-associated phospholipid phosphatase
MTKKGKNNPQQRVARQGARPADDLPEHKLGDTPVPPWEMPSPAQKQAARPVRDALTEALEEIESEEDAERVVETLEAAVGERPAEEVLAGEPKETVDEAARDVERAAHEAAPREPRGAKPARVLAQTARAVEVTEGTDREALAEAAQEVFGHEQLGVEQTWYDRRRDMLRKALLRRMKPLQALDADLFIRINHLPHTRFLNGIFYFITFIWNGGAAWYALMIASVVRQRRMDWHMLRASALPLTIATALVEFPIKSLFRRRRPFISVVRAIVVGMKPGTWSFPSGHAASAFAGAWLLRQHFPRMTPLLYVMASLVGFSRVYLGDHYPGDVVSGSLAGHIFAAFFGRLFGHRKKRG